MALYVRISPDQVSQYDHGYDIEGEVFESVRYTKPHDLTQYANVYVKYSRAGLGSLNIGEFEAVKGQGTGNEHKFTWRIPRNAFYYAGSFDFWLTVRADGLNRTTVPARLLVRETGNVNLGALQT